MKHRSIIREPYQAHASHKATRTGSSYAPLCVRLRVGAAFWRGFHRQMSRRCSFFSQRIRLNGSNVPHACILFGVSWCRLAMPRLMPSVSRMGLCGSLFVVRHSLCQLVSFFQRGVGFFFGSCLFERLVRNFSFYLSLRKFNFESTSSGIRVGIRMGLSVSVCAGVWVCWCLARVCTSGEL